MTQQKETKLAHELANALNDNDSFAAYMGFVEKYSESFLRKTLQKVLSIPEDQIRKTRGALFTYLVNQNGRGNSRD